MTVEPQPAGPTFARSARVNGTCTTYERIYIYIYIKNIYIYMTKIFLSCTISVGLAPLANYACRSTVVQFGPAKGPLNAQRANVGPASYDSKVN